MVHPEKVRLLCRLETRSSFCRERFARWSDALLKVSNDACLFVCLHVCLFVSFLVFRLSRAAQPLRITGHRETRERVPGRDRTGQVGSARERVGNGWVGT